MVVLPFAKLLKMIAVRRFTYATFAEESELVVDPNAVTGACQDAPRSSLVWTRTNEPLKTRSEPS
jgi:hypothetical protein